MTDNALLSQILAGISELRREVSRVSDRLDSLDREPGTPTYPLFSPSVSPGKRLSYASYQSSLNSWAPENTRTVAPQPATLLQKPPVSLKATDPSLGLWVVVPAGGAGTRLWPLSRQSCPPSSCSTSQVVAAPSSRIRGTVCCPSQA